jgi:hypothetical protein
MAVTGNNMAKKIEGWAGFDNDGSAIIGKKLNKYLDKRCTTVIHEGEVERVFTESEVRAIMQKMEESAEANMRTSVQFPGHREVDESVVHDLIDEACEAFGIVIDHVNGPVQFGLAATTKYKEW